MVQELTIYGIVEEDADILVVCAGQAFEGDGTAHGDVVAGNVELVIVSKTGFRTKDVDFTWSLGILLLGRGS